MDAFRLYHSFYEAGLFCDLHLICGSRVVPAHRLILASLSPNLRRILRKFGNGDDPAALVIPDFDADAVKEALDELYAFLVDCDPEKMGALAENKVLGFLNVEMGSSYDGKDVFVKEEPREGNICESVKPLQRNTNLMCLFFC